MSKSYSQEDIDILELENKYGRKAKRRLSKIDKLLNPTNSKLIDLDDEVFEKFLKHLKYVSSSNNNQNVQPPKPNQNENRGV